MTLLAHITAAALLLHSVLGCCFHHGHDAQQVARCGEHGHDHASAPEDAAEHEENAPGEGCQVVRCAFIATTTVELATFAADGVSAPLPPSTAATSLCAATCPPESEDRPCLPGVEKPLALRI
jgi:hypothetical protein